MALSKSTLLIFTAGLIIGGFALYSFMNAQTWTQPVGAPPTNNAPAPVNISGTAQTKSGNLTVADLGAQNVWGNNMVNANYIRAAVQARASAYCDINGANCVDIPQRRVTGTCAVGQTISAINADGTVTCKPSASCQYQIKSGYANAPSCPSGWSKTGDWATDNNQNNSIFYIGCIKCL